MVCSLLLILIPLLSGATKPSSSIVRQKLGDDSRWAAPDWDDRDWADGNSVPARTGIYWLRFRVSPRSVSEANFVSPLLPRDLSGMNASATIDSVFVAAPVSYELFWDGRLLGRSGVVGRTRDEEKTGPLDHVFIVSRELLGEGEHVVAMRFSSFHYNFPAASVTVSFWLSNYASHYASENRRPVFPMLGLGGSLLVALISGVLFGFVDRRRPWLLCSFISILLALFYLLIAWRWLYNDTYEWFCPRLVAITTVMGLIAWLFPWLLLEQFAVPRRSWWMVALLPVLGVMWYVSPVYEVKALWLCRVMLAVSLGIAGWAMWRRQTGAWFLFGGVLAGLVLVRADRRDFLDPSFFIIFSILVLYLFAMLGVQLRADRRRTQDALLTTARLETELLRKNLQPHFLLNTLTAISEVIEQDPPAAVHLIEDLAEEFRSLARISGEKLVPLTQELELCAAHLRVISRRLGKNLSLVSENTVGAFSIPPALLLTLIENGLLHQRQQPAAIFRLHISPIQNGARMIFFSPGESRPSDHRTPGGTGLKYVKTRLEESFFGRWKFSQGAVPGGWETVIELIAPKSPGGVR